jgi:hypothetical protein
MTATAPARLAERVSTRTAQQVSFTSQLMQNYRLATPVAAGSQIAIAHNADGEAEVLTIGTNGHVYDIFPDSGSDTGWSIVDTNFIGGEATSVAAVANPDGTVTIYAANAANAVYSIVSDQRWGPGWQQLPPLSSNESTAVVGIKAGYDPAGNPFLIALSTIHNFYIYQGAQWQPFGEYPSSIYDWCAAWVNDVSPDLGSYPGVYTACTDIVTAGDRGVLGEAWSDGSSNYYGREILGSYSTVAAAMSAQGFSVPFAISTDDHGVYYLHADPSSVSLFDAAKISGDIAVSRIGAGTDAQGLLEVFMLSTDDHLFHVRRDPTVATGWTQPFELNQDLAFVQLVVGKNPAGYSDVFAVTEGNDLYHIWQDPTTTDWHFDEVEVPGRGDIEEFDSYDVRMIVYDQAGSPVPQTVVKIFSDTPVSLEINGFTQYLDANRPWQGLSNAAGEVAIGLKIGALGVTPLTAWTAFMPPSDRIAIDPSAPVRDQLGGLDDAGNDLLQAQATIDGKGTQVPLIQGATNRDPAVVSAVSQGIKKAMSLAATMPGDADPAARSFHARNDSRVARYLAGYDGTSPNRIHRPSVPDQHWLMDFSSGKPVYRDLTADEAKQLIAERQALPPVSSAFGWDLDWGDVFDAVEDGIASVVDFVVDTVTDGIDATITLVIKGVKYVFDATIELVEQTLDLVEEIFDTIEVLFERVFEWLAFIFDWEDILTTHNVVKYASGQMFDFQTGALEAIKPIVDNFFSTMESRVQQAFKTAIDSQLGQNNLAAIQTSPQATPPPQAAMMNHNIVLSGTVNNLHSANAPTGLAAITATPELIQASQNLVQLLDQQATTFESNQAFADAVTYFSQAFAEPDTFVASALAGVFSAAEGITLYALEAANSIVDTVLDAIVAALGALKQILFATWDIPFVSDLYEYLTGSELSVADLGALLVAVPGTVIYKTVTGEAPFPTADSVTQFETAFTAQNLLVRAGLGAAPPSANGSASTVTGASGLATLFGILYGINQMAYGAFEGKLDTNLLESAGAGPGEAVGNGVLARNYSLAALGSEFLAQVFSVPWVAGPSTKGVSCSGAEEFGNLIWIIQWVEFGIDGFFFYTQEIIARVSGDTGATVATLWGALHGGLLLGLAFGTPDGNDDPWLTIENIATFVPEFCKFARIKSVVTDTYGASIGVLGLVDMVGDLTAGFIHLVKAVAE